MTTNEENTGRSDQTGVHREELDGPPPDDPAAESTTDTDGRQEPDPTESTEPMNDEEFQELTEDESMRRADVLQTITKPTRRNLLVMILIHPRRMPSRTELAFMSPDVDNESTVWRHLRKLMNVGIVEEVELDDDRKEHDLPHKFYTVSDPGMEFLENHGLVPEKLEALRKLYRARNKPDKIERYQNAPRPGDPPIHDADVDVNALAMLLKEFKETGDVETAVQKLIQLSEGTAPEVGGVDVADSDTTDVSELEGLADSGEWEPDDPESAKAELARLLH